MVLVNLFPDDDDEKNALEICGVLNFVKQLCSIYKINFFNYFISKLVYSCQEIFFFSSIF